jgi:hypothetical protein
LYSVSSIARNTSEETAENGTTPPGENGTDDETQDNMTGNGKTAERQNRGVDDS